MTISKRVLFAAAAMLALSMPASAANMIGKLIALQDQRITTPAQALKVVADNIDSKSFITMAYGVIDLDRREMRYARAGHCPLIRIGRLLPARAGGSATAISWWRAWASAASGHSSIDSSGPIRGSQRWRMCLSSGSRGASQPNGEVAP